MTTASSLAYLFLSAAFLWLGLRWFERVQLYIPSRNLDVHPASFGLAYENVEFPAADGVKLHGWWIPGSASGPVILLMHGNGGNISHRVEKASLLHSLGASVFLFDYRGYGKSAGRPSERGLYRDALGARHYLIAVRGVDPASLIYYGESLGCGVAVELALRHAPRALVLESPFTSVVDMGRLLFPWLPVSLMVKDRFDNLAKLPLVRAPLLLLHSPEDSIVPFEMGLRLFNAAAEPKSLVKLRGDHNEGFLESGRIYLDALGEFFKVHARS